MGEIIKHPRVSTNGFFLAFFFYRFFPDFFCLLFDFSILELLSFFSSFFSTFFHRVFLPRLFFWTFLQKPAAERQNWFWTVPVPILCLENKEVQGTHTHSHTRARTHMNTPPPGGRPQELFGRRPVRRDGHNLWRAAWARPSGAAAQAVDVKLEDVDSCVQ